MVLDEAVGPGLQGQPLQACVKSTHSSVSKSNRSTSLLVELRDPQGSVGSGEIRIDETDAKVPGLVEADRLEAGAIARGMERLSLAGAEDDPAVATLASLLLGEDVGSTSSQRSAMSSPRRSQRRGSRPDRSITIGKRGEEALCLLWRHDPLASATDCREP